MLLLLVTVSVVSIIIFCLTVGVSAHVRIQLEVDTHPVLVEKRRCIETFSTILTPILSLVIRSVCGQDVLPHVFDHHPALLTRLRYGVMTFLMTKQIICRRSFILAHVTLNLLSVAVDSLHVIRYVCEMFTTHTAHFLRQHSLFSTMIETFMLFYVLYVFTTELAVNQRFISSSVIFHMYVHFGLQHHFATKLTGNFRFDAISFVNDQPVFVEAVTTLMSTWNRGLRRPVITESVTVI